VISLTEDFDDQMEGLDQKISTILKVHEYEYMQAINIYIKRKETELK
jgi:chromosome segregation ATPase